MLYATILSINSLKLKVNALNCLQRRIKQRRRNLVRLARETNSPSDTVLAWNEKYPIQEEILKYYVGMSTEQLEHAGVSNLLK